MTIRNALYKYDTRIFICNISSLSNYFLTLVKKMRSEVKNRFIYNINFSVFHCLTVYNILFDTFLRNVLSLTTSFTTLFSLSYINLSRCWSSAENSRKKPPKFILLMSVFAFEKAKIKSWTWDLNLKTSKRNPDVDPVLIQRIAKGNHQNSSLKRQSLLLFSLMILAMSGCHSLPQPFHLPVNQKRVTW